MTVPRLTGSRTQKSPSRAAVRARRSSLRASGVGTPPLVATTGRGAECLASEARAGALVAIQVLSDAWLRMVVTDALLDEPHTFQRGARASSRANSRSSTCRLNR